MKQDLLLQIQKMQFSSKSEAEALLLEFMQNTFPMLGISSVTLRPQAVSLNSFNGFLSCRNGTELFFKTHVEQDNVIDEYYNANMLAHAGYPVIQPLYSSKKSGRQILIYEVVSAPSVFEVARSLETISETLERDFDLAHLTTSQNASDDDLLKIYLDTLTPQTADESVKQPIHQLFFHRLTGGRLERFYGKSNSIELPDGEHSLADIRQCKWVINGVSYKHTIDDTIAISIEKLNPYIHTSQPSIIGHGDAHNGNVFYSTEEGLTYFDPAFAGRHHPLLDLTKPLFHNVYAMWIYFPEDESAKLNVSIHRKGETIYVEHNYVLTPVREMFWKSKVERVLVPILKHLHKTNQLRSDWRSYLKSALFCCPFLTLNLTQFPSDISLLGLSMAVEMGAESIIGSEKSRLDQEFDDIELLLQ